jgi:S-adenosylmethionine-diacylglycerol 3-amino-3-carboxypropyl transferase
VIDSSEDLVREAVHSKTLKSRTTLMERLFSLWFDGFVYNQIWEDPRVDLEALKLQRSSRMLTIASGGCNTVTYLQKQPAAIYAVDINRCHIYLTRLKLAAVQSLPTYSDFFNFFGCADSSINISNYYTYICHNLDETTRSFWEGGSWLRKKVIGPRIEYFTNNFYNYAKLGYLLRFCHKLAKIVRRDPAKLLNAKSLEEQEKVFNETIAPFLDNKVVQLIGKQPLILFSLGIPPRQLEALRKDMSGDWDVICLYRERLRRLTCEFPIEDNYFTWQALSRGYDRSGKRAIPDYLKEENYKVIKDHAHVVTTAVTPVTAFLKMQPKRSLDRFVLLDAQDWMEKEQIEELWREIARVGKPGTRIIFRTGASRSPIESALPDKLLKRYVYEEELSRQLHRKDRSAIYGGFHVYHLPS